MIEKEMMMSDLTWVKSNIGVVKEMMMSDLTWVKSI